MSLQLFDPTKRFNENTTQIKSIVTVGLSETYAEEFIIGHDVIMARNINVETLDSIETLLLLTFGNLFGEGLRSPN